MKPHRLALALLAVLNAASVLADPPTAAEAALPPSVLPPLRSFKQLPTSGCGFYPSVPRQTAASLQTGPGLTQRTTVAYSSSHKCWLEVQPVLPVTAQSIRVALANSESRFAAEEVARRQRQVVLREQIEEQRMMQEALNFARRYRLVAIRDSQPSGEGLATLLATRPYVFTHSERYVIPPPRPEDMNPNCPYVQAYRYYKGLGPRPPGLKSITVTQRN